MKQILFVASLFLSLNALGFWEIRNSVADKRPDGSWELREYQQAHPPELILPGEAPKKILIEGKLPEEFGKKILRFRHKVGGKTETIKLHLLPESFPFFHLHGRSVIDKPIITAVYETEKKISTDKICHLLILSPVGELVFQRKLENKCSDFRPHDLEGKRYYSYQLVESTEPSVGHFGPRIILDSEFKPIQTVAPYFDSHEFILLGKDHWLGIEIELSRMASGLPYFNKRVRERKNGKIIFDWGVSDYLKQFGSEATANSYVATYHGEIVAELLHINSVQSIGESGYVVSLGMNGVVYVNKETRKVDWVLGGFNDQFSLKREEYPVFQHTAWLDPENNRLSLFANWGSGLAKVTRVLSYDLDLIKKKVKKFTEIRAKGESSLILGSVQLSGGVYTISFGTKDWAKHDIIEMDGDKDTLSISFPRDRNVYRVYREPWR